MTQVLEDGKPRHAQAPAVQACKACCQACLSGSSWRLAWAWAFTGLPDPLAKRRLAGTVGEFKITTSWVKAEDEIVRKAAGLDGHPHRQAGGSARKGAERGSKESRGPRSNRCRQEKHKYLSASLAVELIRPCAYCGPCAG